MKMTATFLCCFFFRNSHASKFTPFVTAICSVECSLSCEAGRARSPHFSYLRSYKRSQNSLAKPALYSDCKQKLGSLYCKTKLRFIIYHDRNVTESGSHLIESKVKGKGHSATGRGGPRGSG